MTDRPEMPVRSEIWKMMSDPERDTIREMLRSRTRAPVARERAPFVRRNQGTDRLYTKFNAPRNASSIDEISEAVASRLAATGRRVVPWPSDEPERSHSVRETSSGPERSAGPCNSRMGLGLHGDASTFEASFRAKRRLDFGDSGADSVGELEPSRSGTVLDHREIGSAAVPIIILGGPTPPSSGDGVARSVDACLDAKARGVVASIRALSKSVSRIHEIVQSIEVMVTALLDRTSETTSSHGDNASDDGIDADVCVEDSVSLKSPF